LTAKVRYSDQTCVEGIEKPSHGLVGEIRHEDVSAQRAAAVAVAVLPQQQLPEKLVLAQHGLFGATTAAITKFDSSFDIYA
jgi:hypothetical protein